MDNFLMTNNITEFNARLSTINQQPSTLLPVMEHFYTLQGEGYHQGKAAYFIRLGGCDVGCVWCDVKDSWDATKHPQFNIDDLIFNIEKTPAKFVVITGGEPLMHNLDELTAEIGRAHV